MQIFISWSGARSGTVASSLQWWIPRVVQAVEPWLSSASIDPGTRWSEEVSGALEETHCGILCVTAENVGSPWLLFEAGALSKVVSKSRVIPYLIGLEPAQVQGPLAQFQAVRADKSGTWLLLTAINSATGSALLDPALLSESFDLWWPKLEGPLQDAIKLTVSEPVVTPRSVEDMMGEVLEILRARKFVDSDPDRVVVSSAAPAVGGTMGARIRLLRSQKGITQDDLAMRALVSPSMISQLENGRVRPSAATLQKIAGALNVSIDSILGGPVSSVSSPTIETPAAEAAQA